MKYTKEIMEKACIDAKSVAQVCRNLGLKPAGGNYRTVKSNLEKFGIDTEHETFNFGSWVRIPYLGHTFVYINYLYTNLVCENRVSKMGL